MRKAIDIETSEEAYRREVKATRVAPPERKWGQFVNRTDGPLPWRPMEGGSGSGTREKPEKVRANAVTPQPPNEPSRPRDRERQRYGRKISRVKCDLLRAAGKCFQCEETGHDQRNCPRLHSARRPTASSANIRVSSVSFDAEGATDDTTGFERRAYELCAAEWGDDRRWLDIATRATSRYGVHQYSTGWGDLVEIFDSRQPEVGVLEVAVSRLGDPSFRLSEVHSLKANTNLMCIREGGYRDRKLYRPWGWTALEWLKRTLNEQMSLENTEDSVSVQPALDGYCVHLQKADVTYGLKHAEVLGDAFNPRRVLNQMRAIKSLSKEDRPAIFRSTPLNQRQRQMVYSVRLTVGASQTRKRTKRTEGASTVERTAMRLKEQTRKVPEPVVVLVKINGHQVRALLDTGSMADFLSTTVTDQLNLRKEYYSKPLSVQLAVHGSRSKINCGTRVNFRYQNIDCERRFDIMNLDNYNAILGTPFLFQHKVAIGLNPSCVVIGSDKPLELNGPEMITVTSAATDLFNDELDGLRAELRKEAEDLCTDPSKTALPPLRAVNHTIPLIDRNKVYRFRPSKCPEAFREPWLEKKNSYLATGRWRTTTGYNAIPLLMIPKASINGEKPRLRTVFDKREQNANTHKLASPLPDIEEILREVSKHEFRSLIDGRDAYEQIRVVPEDVPLTLFTTPDGTMESLVMQQGDCNAGATYQTLMNHIFASYIGVFMYVYLDDIIIFSDSAKEHVEHIKTIFGILRKERLFLGLNKMQFFAKELKILGHVIDDKGIRMDPHKVDKVLNWKTPTNKDLLRSFIGAVGFLAPDCKGIRVPMGHLSSLTAETRPWKWDETAQRSFDQVKQIVNEHRDNRRKALDYRAGADPIYVTTDGCLTGGGGYVSQGKNPETANVVAFWSGKWNAAQQNYPVHEQELLSLVETLKRFRGVLQGTKFIVRTDHKALEHFMKQRNLSPRQHRWIDVLSEFDFNIQYIPGETNEFADALSRIYSDEPKGVIRAESELVDEGDEVITRPVPKVHPVYVETSLLLLMNVATRRSARIADKPAPRYKESRDRKVRNEKSERESTEMVQDSSEVVEPPQSSKVLLDPPEPEPFNVTPVQGSNGLFEASSNLGISFPDCIRDRYSEDVFYRPILANPKDFTNFVIRDGLIFFRSEGLETIAIPDVRVGEQNVREVLIRQGHSILAHLSDEKTATYMRNQVWWKSMVSDIADYCRSCHTCATSKPQIGKPHGKLKTMPVPTYPWQYIGVDFVGPLPESTNRTGGYDMICVVIDQLTSMVHLIPSKQTYRATDVAELMFEAVYKLHGLPERIVSDRDSLFTSRFWKRLHRLLGTELRMSSAFHPQTDGATERANRTVTQMIRQCVRPDQKDWVIKLPAIEFALNSARSSTTGFSPFQLNYGRNPSPMIWRGQEEYPGVRKFAEKMKLAIMSAHDSIIAARVVNTVQANRKWSFATYKVGDLAYLSTKNISLPKGRARKLSPKYLGPFAIVKILKDGATYQLDLSEELIKRGINRSFHASLLKPHVPNDDRRFPGRLPSQVPGFSEKPDEWVVDAITAHHGRGVRSEFEILWKAGDRTWAPYREVAHLIAMDRYCELMGVGDPHDLPETYPRRGNDSGVMVGAVEVGFEQDISLDIGSNDAHQPTMTRSFSSEEWSECASYAQKLDSYLQDGRIPPGQAPPRYPEYRQTVGQGWVPPTQSHAASTFIPYYGSPVQPPAPTTVPSNTISMPPEALNSFFDAQIRMVELVVKRPHHNPAPRRYTPPSRAVRGRARGRGMARGARGRNRFGRSRPSLSLNKLGLEEGSGDIAMSGPSDFSDLFGVGSDSDAGPSSLAVSTPVTTPSIAPGVPEDETMSERLVNEMGDIRLGGSVAGGEDGVGNGEGSGAEFPNGFEFA